MPNRDTLYQQRKSLSARTLAADVDSVRIGAYHGYAELVDRWLACVESGAQVQVIGHSVAGTPLFALAVGPERAPTTSVVMAGIHPIEWIGVEVLLALLDRLCQHPPRDRRVIALPLVNVDGYRLVEADLRAGRRRWRRSNARGVDLNRNWPTRGRARPRRGRIAGWGSTGPQPLSEPETAAITGALDAIHSRAPVTVAVSLHSIGRMILLPYGSSWRPPRAAERLRQAAQSIQERIPYRYTVRQVSHWLPGLFARGVEIDCLHDRYGALALLVECSRGGLRLGAPGSWLHPFRWYNPPQPEAEIGALCQGLEPLLRGVNWPLVG